MQALRLSLNQPCRTPANSLPLPSSRLSHPPPAPPPHHRPPGLQPPPPLCPWPPPPRHCTPHASEFPAASLFLHLRRLQAPAFPIPLWHLHLAAGLPASGRLHLPILGLLSTQSPTFPLKSYLLLLRCRRHRCCTSQLNYLGLLRHHRNLVSIRRRRLLLDHGPCRRSVGGGHGCLLLRPKATKQEAAAGAVGFEEEEEERKVEDKIRFSIKHPSIYLMTIQDLKTELNKQLLDYRLSLGLSCAAYNLSIHHSRAGFLQGTSEIFSLMRYIGNI